MSESTFKCEPFPFQRGDEVVVISNGKQGIITAVGVQYCMASEKLLGIVYRVGRSTYWHGWQLKRARASTERTKG